MGNVSQENDRGLAVYWPYGEAIRRNWVRLRQRSQLLNSVNISTMAAIRCETSAQLAGFYDIALFTFTHCIFTDFRGSIYKAGKPSGRIIDFGAPLQLLCNKILSSYEGTAFDIHVI